MKSLVSCVCATLAAWSLSTSLIWPRFAINVRWKTACAKLSVRTERGSRSAIFHALDCWRCRASASAHRSASPAITSARAVAERVPCAITNRCRFPFCVWSKKKRAGADCFLPAERKTCCGKRDWNPSGRCARHYRAKRPDGNAALLRSARA